MVPWRLKSPRALEREKHSPKHLPAKKKGFFRRYWWVFVATPLAFMLAAFGALYVAYRQIELPDTLPPIQTTYLYDRNGNVLTTLHGAVDRTIVPLGADLAEPATRGDRHRGRTASTTTPASTSAASCAPRGPTW